MIIPNDKIKLPDSVQLSISDIVEDGFKTGYVIQNGKIVRTYRKKMGVTALFNFMAKEYKKELVTDALKKQGLL